MSCFNFSDNEIETAIGRIKQNMEVLVRMTEEDKKLIINHVAKFIKSNNDVIVYGGYAQNLLIYRQCVYDAFLKNYNLPSVPKFFLADDGKVDSAKIKPFISSGLNGGPYSKETIEYYNFIQTRGDFTDCFYNISFDKTSNDSMLKEAHDFDIYSPCPIYIAKKIYDICVELGYEARIHEAIHPGTYSVKISSFDGSSFNVCDVTYIPNFIFYKIKKTLVITINDMPIITNSMIFLDFYKMFSDTVCSNFRFEVVLKERFCNFIKHCGLKRDYSTNIFCKFNNYYIFKIIEEFKFNPSVVVTGFKAYNTYKNIFAKDTCQEFRSPYIKNFFYEFISVDYIQDNDRLKKILDEKRVKYEIIERQRFCYYLDKSTEYYYVNDYGEKILFCVIYGNNNLAIPFKIINDYGRNYKITSHTYTVYHFLALHLSQKIFNDTVKEGEFSNVRYRIDSYEFLKIAKILQEMQDAYTKIKNISILQESPFEFITISTIGIPVNTKEYRFNCKSDYKFFSLDSSTSLRYTDQELLDWAYYINMSGNIITENQSITIHSPTQSLSTVN